MPIELKPWQDLLMEKKIAKEPLAPTESASKEIRARYMPRRRKKGRDGWKLKTEHLYYDEPVDDFKIINDNTVFYYYPNPWPDPYSETFAVAGIFLKGVINEEIQKQAYDCLRALPWDRKPQRPETKPAVDRQKGQANPAREEGMGYHGKGTPQTTLLTRRPELTAGLEPLFIRIEEIFSTVLPEYWRLQNTPMTAEQWRREKALRGGTEKANYKGVPARFRLFDTCFSNAALLRSCPAAVHRDGNSPARLPNFPCLTSIGNPDLETPFSGGRFCLLEHKVLIPVTPGAVLIHQTTKDWHTNIGPVEGEKFSLVLYYQTRLTQLRKEVGLPQGTLPTETDETKRRDILLSHELTKRGTPEVVTYRLKRKKP